MAATWEGAAARFMRLRVRVDGCSTLDRSDWRAEAYAQAATRPCWTESWYQVPRVCRGTLRSLHPAVALAFTGRCQSTPPVAR